ncbi:HAD hydrolase-like protein [Thalassovita taeanensis]|nr:HAD hydrolase-like protein [Thalassovita taeanensis]
MRTVIFDLDGTLADTSGDLIAAANTCFRQMGAGDMLSAEQDAGTALRGGKAMLRLGLERMAHDDIEAQIEVYYPHLLTAYGTAIDVHTTLYPGAMQAVQALSTAGYKVGICTNKPAGLAETLMTRLGVRQAFGSLVGADTLPVRKPDPAPLREAVLRAGGDPAASVLIGDTATDRNTAAAMGVPCILVTFGPGDHDVRALEPEGLIGHFDELPGVVQTLIG